MELQTVSMVSKAHGISTRMLRYYEQNGLMTSQKMAGYSYRVYDNVAIKRLQQVIILRKLQIPVKQIRTIINNPDAETVVEIFKQNIQALDSEITALSTIKEILTGFINRLEEIANVNLNLDFLNGDSVLELSGTLSLVQKNIKEKFTMNELNQAAEIVNKLHNVRVVYLPPMTVASYRHVGGENPEENATKAVDDFVRSSGLLQTKPDLRQFGFDHPTGEPDNHPGYEIMVSVPDDMNIPEPLVKKKLRGGMYAAYTVDIDGFESWLGMQDWVNESEKYRYDNDLARIQPAVAEINCFGGIHLFLEERLNYYHNVQDINFDASEMQRDMLMPIIPAEIIEESTIEIPDSIEKCGFNAQLFTRNKIAIAGFTRIITPDLGEIPGAGFANEINADGRLDILNKFRKPGASILGFGSHDLDSQRNGSWRWTFGILESDVTDMAVFMKYGPIVKRVDASRWIRFELPKSLQFDTDSGHSAAPKLGYVFNGIVSGHINEYPDGNLGILDDEAGVVIYHWYPVK